MNCEDQGMSRVVQSWARLAPAGQTALEEALMVFNPMSKDLFHSERQMMSFLQDLQKDGVKPVILKSKDVYGYTSCNTEPLGLKSSNSKVQRVQKAAKRRSRRGPGKAREVNYAMLSRAAKDIVQNQPKILLTNLSVDSLKHNLATTMEPRSVQAQPCLKLTNIKGLTGGHTARLQIHCNPESQATSSRSQGCPPDLSGIPDSPSGIVSQTSTVVALDNKRALSCPVKVDDALIGDSAPLVYQNGFDLKDGSIYKKIQTISGKPDVLTSGLDRRIHFQSFNWPQSTYTNGRDVSRLNHKGLEWKVIKVDSSVPDEEVRRKAQKILRVNLSPVIQIHPLVDSIDSC